METGAAETRLVIQYHTNQAILPCLSDSQPSLPVTEQHFKRLMALNFEKAAAFCQNFILFFCFVSGFLCKRKRQILVTFFLLYFMCRQCAFGFDFKNKIICVIVFCKHSGVKSGK